MCTGDFALGLKPAATTMYLAHDDLVTRGACSQSHNNKKTPCSCLCCLELRARQGRRVTGNHAGEGAGVVRFHNSVPEPFTCRVGWEHLLWSSLESFPYCSAVCDIKNFLICHHCTDPLRAFQRYLFFSCFADTHCEVALFERQWTICCLKLV